MGLEVLRGLTTPLTVTVEEPDGTCGAVAGSPGQQPQGPTPAPTGTVAPSEGARLGIQPIVEEWCGSIGGCTYFADLVGPDGLTHRMELTIGLGLDLPVAGPVQFLPLRLDPGRYTLSLEGFAIDDVSFDGQPPEVTLGARCVESFDLAPGQTKIEVRVVFGIESCEVTTTLEPD